MASLSFQQHTSECVLREATDPLPIPAPEHRAAFLWATHKRGMPATPTGGPRLESQTRHFHQRVNAHRAAMFYPGSGTGPLFCSLVPFPPFSSVFPGRGSSSEILQSRGGLAIAGSFVEVMWSRRYIFVGICVIQLVRVTSVYSRVG